MSVFFIFQFKSRLWFSVQTQILINFFDYIYLKLCSFWNDFFAYGPDLLENVFKWRNLWLNSDCSIEKYLSLKWPFSRFIYTRFVCKLSCIKKLFSTQVSQAQSDIFFNCGKNPFSITIWYKIRGEWMDQILVILFWVVIYRYWGQCVGDIPYFHKLLIFNWVGWKQKMVNCVTKLSGNVMSTVRRMTTQGTASTSQFFCTLLVTYRPMN